MKKYKNLPYTTKFQWRIRCLKLLIVVMIIYMVFIAEMGGGDSHIMTQTAQNVSRLLFFGGLLYIIYMRYHLVQSEKRSCVSKGKSFQSEVRK